MLPEAHALPVRTGGLWGQNSGIGASNGSSALGLGGEGFGSVGTHGGDSDGLEGAGEE